MIKWYWSLIIAFIALSIGFTIVELIRGIL